ncbi:MAG: hypothetical protein PSY12_06485, partial [bacterium]|nr:hypothetical protein [bacterium]
MSGGSTIVDFWRDDQIAAGKPSHTDDILLLNQAVLDIDDDDSASEMGNRTTNRVRIALLAVGIIWIGFAGWAILSSGQAQAGPAAWPGLVATILIPLILLGVAYLLLIRNSRTESRRYLDTARALRTEADLLELRLGRIADQLESARQTMQDQAELLDSYGAAASSNMEASAELIAGRALSTAEQAETAERATTALVARMDTLIATMPELEDRAGRMAAQIMDNGHALSERIDTLETRLHSLAELSDDARARTLSATKSLSSQLTQLQETTRSTTQEVTGMADIASSRIEATAHSARQAMEQSRQQLETQSADLAGLVEQAQSGIVATSDLVRTTLSHDLDEVQADLRLRLDGAIQTVQGAMNATDERLSRQSETLDTLVARTHASIDGASESAMAMLARDMGAIEQDLRQRLDAALARAQQTLVIT